MYKGVAGETEPGAKEIEAALISIRTMQGLLKFAEQTKDFTEANDDLSRAAHRVTAKVTNLSASTKQNPTTVGAGVVDLEASVKHFFQM